MHGPEPGDSDAVRPSVHAQPSAEVGAELAPSRPVSVELAEPSEAQVSADQAQAPGAETAPAKQVLVAHGRSERWMRAVVHMLERTGVHDVTILNERSSERGALAEQFGERAPDSRYAVVLLTADDIGAARADSEDEPFFSPRAHQGVVFEMGFLGRGARSGARVRALRGGRPAAV